MTLERACRTHTLLRNRRRQRAAAGRATHGMLLRDALHFCIDGRIFALLKGREGRCHQGCCLRCHGASVIGSGIARSVQNNSCTINSGVLPGCSPYGPDGEILSPASWVLTAGG